MRVFSVILAAAASTPCYALTNYPARSASIIRSAVDRRTLLVGGLDAGAILVEISKVRSRYASEWVSSEALTKRDVQALPAFDIRSRRSRQVGRRQANTATISLADIDQFDDGYLGQLNIGTPAQSLPVGFDTIATDLIIPLSTCFNCTAPTFNSASSTTFVASSNAVNLTAIDGTPIGIGVQASDVVSLGGITVNSAQLVAVNSQPFNGSGFPTTTMGLNLAPSNFTGKDSFFVTLAKSSLLMSNVFSFAFARGGAAGSELCMGCIDSTKFTGNIVYQGLNTSVPYWNLPSTGLFIDGQTPGPIVNAVFDTEFPWLYTSAEYAKAFYANIVGAKDASKTFGPGAWTIPCSFNGTVSYGFGTGNFVINPLDFNLGPADPHNTTCVGGLFSVDLSFVTKSTYTVIGTEFMKSWYTVFDYGNQQIGFAAAV